MQAGSLQDRDRAKRLRSNVWPNLAIMDSGAERLCRSFARVVARLL